MWALPCAVASCCLSTAPRVQLVPQPGRGPGPSTTSVSLQALRMSDGILSKAATMEIPISSNGDTSSLPEDDGLEQDLQQVMVSGPNLNETSIVSGGYGGTAGGIIPTGTIKGTGAAFRGSGTIVGQRGSAPLSAPDS